VTRDGELATSVRDVDDPDELSRYSEFDVSVTQRRRRRRRKRKSSDDDVTGPAADTSAARSGKYGITCGGVRGTESTAVRLIRSLTR